MELLSIANMSSNFTEFNLTFTTQTSPVAGQQSAVTLAEVGKMVIMLPVIFFAIFGNCLVIISVIKFRKLHYISNAFVVSLAVADMSVASLVMTFSAIQEIRMTWSFGQVVCDVFNANDVMFSTASLLHLCCISIDRYIGVTRPLNYPQIMTKRRVAVMLGIVWGLSAAIAHLPVHLGLYSKPGYRYITDNHGLCVFSHIDRYYALVSSSTSFWIPATVMIIMYSFVFRKAREQEKRISEQLKQLHSIHANTQNSDVSSKQMNAERRLSNERKAFKREHKAAKTLGFLMTVFLFCWLPFFIWYLTTNLCGAACPELPVEVMFCMFWLGYLNSALNPVVYAMHNKLFRDSFYVLLHCGRVRKFCRSTCCCKRCSSATALENAQEQETRALQNLNRKISVYTQPEVSRNGSLTSVSSDATVETRLTCVRSASFFARCETVPEEPDEPQHTTTLLSKSP